MSEIKKATNRNWAFWVCLVISIALGIVGFFMPPKGVIDGSVLTFAGVLCTYVTLHGFLFALDKGIDAKFKHGNTEVTIRDSNN
ncbi:MAG: hypothetical protein II817_00660 [Bacteroidales bacterium]|nr:hypothetical protein [Bacteroidales bacterium]